MLGKLPLLMAFLAMGSYGAFEVWQRMTACVAEIHADVMSPNSLRRAVLYSMDCRATSGRDTHAALMPTDAGLKPERQPPFFVVDGSHDIGLSWQNDRTLVVTMPPGKVDVQQQEDFAGPVRIIYRHP
jgi:heme exporter protein D